MNTSRHAAVVAAIQNRYKLYELSKRKAIMLSLVVTASVLFLLYKYVLQISPSVMVHHLMADFQLNGLIMGTLTASWFWSLLLFQFIAGPLLDRYSVKWIGALALLVAAAGALAFSQAENLTQALWARALMGAGAAFATVSYLKLTADWFSGRAYAIVSGLLITGVMLGSILAQSPLAWLVEQTSWHQAMLYCAILGLFIALAYLVMVPSAKTTAEYRPQSSHSQTIQLKDCLSVLRSSQNWWLMLYSGLAFTPLAVFGGLWGNTCLETLHHLTPIEASAMTSTLFIGLGIGGPLLGFLSGHYLSRRNCLYLGLLLSLIGFATVLYLPIHSQVWIGCMLFVAGLGTSSFMLGFGVGKDINPIYLAATVVCMINTGDSILAAITEPLMGALLDLTGSPTLVNGAENFSVHGYQLTMGIMLLYLLFGGLCVRQLRDECEA